MGSEVISVGYTCPVCKYRVCVLRSGDQARLTNGVICSECTCGHVRIIQLSEIQSLDVWRERAA